MRRVPRIGIDQPLFGSSGSGSYTEVELEELRWLREILPVSGCDKTGGGDDVKSPRGSIRDEGGGRIYENALDKSTYQPSRRYFCNADGSVADMLKGCVDAVRVGLRLS